MFDDDPNVNNSKQGYELITVWRACNVIMIIGGWNAICLVSILYKIINVLGIFDIFQNIALVSITMIGCIVFRILSYSTKTETGTSYGINVKNIQIWRL